jgi:hypothetical protein
MGLADGPAAAAARGGELADTSGGADAAIADDFGSASLLCGVMVGGVGGGGPVGAIAAPAGVVELADVGERAGAVPDAAGCAAGVAPPDSLLRVTGAGDCEQPPRKSTKPASPAAATRAQTPSLLIVQPE